MNDMTAKAAPDTRRYAKPLLRGINHLALTTEDMKATTDFYSNVLGLPMIHAMKVPHGVAIGPKNRGNPPYEDIRHYFWDMGNDSLLAFFEIPKGVKKQSDRDDIGGMQHLAFAVSAQNFKAMIQRLKDHGVKVDGPVEIFDNIYSCYFYDPNGIRLELCCKPEQGEEQRIIDTFIQSRKTAAEELKTLHADPAWVDRVASNLS